MFLNERLFSTLSFFTHTPAVVVHDQDSFPEDDSLSRGQNDKSTHFFASWIGRFIHWIKLLELSEQKENKQPGINYKFSLNVCVQGPKGVEGSRAPA